MFAELVRKLERDFAAPQIREALGRLVERGYVITATNFTQGIAAAYWASLGLPPEAAKKNLQKCRVRIQAIDVEGGAELGAALSRLGVRVVKRSPDLTVTLVSDYLDERLARIEPRSIWRTTRRWLLAQPSGIFPLVGPVFTPRRGRVLDMSCRPDEAESGGQGAARSQRGAVRRGFAARPACARTKRHPSSRPSRSPRRSPPTFAPN